MTLIPPSLDYTDKDHDALALRLQNLIRSVFPQWTDFAVGNFGNILLGLYAFVGDVLCFYQDNQALESRIATSEQRKNMLALVKLLGYRPSTASAATVDETFALAAVPVGSVTFPTGTKVKTAAVTDPVAFQLLAPLTIPGGASPPTATATVEHSETFVEMFAATGLADQEIVLFRTPYLDGTADVSAGNGAYVEVDSFLESGSADRHYVTAVDQNDQVTARFGNGINGAIPTGTISAIYRVGGGEGGNVEASSLVKLEGSYTDAFGNPVTVAVTNPLPATGGTDRETVNEIRANAPESLRTLTRTVAREDYEINARRVSGVARALMLTSDQHIGISENSGMLFVIPAGGGLPSSGLKAAVLTMVTETYPNTVTFHVDVMGPIYKAISVRAVVYLRQGTTATTVKAAIEGALATWFAVSNPDGTPNENVDFGYNLKDAYGAPAGEIAWSDVFNVVRDVTGVRKVDEGPTGFLLNGVRSDVAIDPQEFPTLGTVTLINGDTGNPL